MKKMSTGRSLSSLCTAMQYLDITGPY